MKHKNGFTLIELLIVVAIIAILAAIAVPNFLEAQVRAKISRVLGDMRTVATAIESYRIDEGRVPIGHWEAKNWSPKNFGLSQEVSNEFQHSRLTTPIAYISTIARDPFVNLTGQTDAGGNLLTGPGWTMYHYQSVRSKTGQMKSMGTVYNNATAKGLAWTLSSVGPSTQRNIGGKTRHVVSAAAGITVSSATTYPDLIYDASNGTKSFGYLIMSNKGVAGN